MLHLIYNSNAMQTYHRAQKAGGSWSEPELIGDTSKYWVGAVPNGSLCYAWAEYEQEPGERNTDVFHMKFYKNGQWQEEPKTYDFNGERDRYGFDILWLQVAFDAQGEPHFFYYVRMLFYITGDGNLHELYGLLLDEQALLLSEEVDDSAMSPQAEGVGDLSRYSSFHIDGGNAYHLMGWDESSSDPDSFYPSYTRYIHSNSRNGGKTWEGPFVVFENEGGMGNDEVSVAETPDGGLRLTAYYSRSDQRRLMTTLTPDSARFETPEEYYNYRQFFDGLETLPYEEAMKYGLDQTGFLWAVPFDGKGVSHYITEKFWDITQTGGNVWVAREIKKPEEDAAPAVVLLRRNGNFVLLAKTADKLYSAEIPAKG